MSAAAAADDVHAMSSLDLSDVMDDFSQMNVGSVVVACLLMVCTHSPFCPVGSIGPRAGGEGRLQAVQGYGPPVLGKAFFRAVAKFFM